MLEKMPKDQANWFSRLIGYDLYLEVWETWGFRDWLLDNDMRGLEVRFPYREYWFGPFHLIITELA